ncbi:MAG: hypothetical protein AAGJ93_03515 [Bacteroidota bacterium]
MNSQQQQYGIEQTKEMFDAIQAIKEAVELSKKDDGKVTFPQDMVNFVAPIPRIITGFTGANQIPREMTDLDGTELDELREKFGDIVDDERWQRAFYGLAIAGDAIYEIIADGSGENPLPDNPQDEPLG